MRTTVIATLIALLVLIFFAGLGRGPSPGSGVHAQTIEPAAYAPAFKITFGLRQKYHGRNWAGVLTNPGQVRSIRGWHLDSGDTITPPDRWDVTQRTIDNDMPAKAVILEVASPESEPVVIYTRNGNLSFKPEDVPWGGVYYFPETGQNVSVERVPAAQTATPEEGDHDDPALIRARDGEYWMAWVAYKTLARSGDLIEGGDQVMVARSRDGVAWTRSESLTPPGDHFRVALAQDSRGRIWCVYSVQKKIETGGFDLFARSWDGSRWSDEQQLTNDPNPDIFHRLASDAQGNLYLVWMGYRNGQSDILMRVFSRDRWGEEINVSASREDDWEPALAVDRSGRAWIAWDSYRATAGPASYDVLLRSYSAAALGPVQGVSQTPLAEMRADVAVDGAGRVWLAWEEGPANWGKDSGYENPKHRIHLRKGGAVLYGRPNQKIAYRRPRVAVLEGGQWKQSAAALGSGWSAEIDPNLLQSPRLAVDGAGRGWVLLRHQNIAKGRWAGHLFDFYATTLTGAGEAQKWLAPVLLPGSTGRQDTVVATAPGGGGQLIAAVVGDGRRLPVPLPVKHEIATMAIHAPAIRSAEPRLTAFQPSSAGEIAIPHRDEPAQVAQVRGHRVNVAGKSYKIIRGDLHRHTEVSMDGAVDGTIFDMYRYALNAADLDFVAVTDHNYGAWLDTDEPESRNTDDIYQWWRTQKSADMFYVPGRFVPLYGYERSINFPLGHRNIIHVRRGVFSLRVPKLYIAERGELVEKDAHALWAYLKRTDGVGLPHTSGTSMGTDWRLRDDGLEPVTEIYQGDRNSYEEEGAPRAATKEVFGPGSSGRAPYQRGLIWNALGAGYRMGFIASSDHFTTHISYANLLVPVRATTRADIQEALRERRTYASTDNIVLDFDAGAAVQGGEMASAESPVFRVTVIGTEPVRTVEVIKNNRVIFTKRPEPDARDPRRVAFTFRDSVEFGGDFGDSAMQPTSQIRDWSRPETGIRGRPRAEEAYYYVRVVQSFSAQERDMEGEVAWSSPIWVRRRGR